MKTDKVSYTSISELIEELKGIQERIGDIPVCVGGASPVWCNTLPYYYDGGFVLQDANNPKNYLSSRTYNPEKKWTEKTKGFPEHCIHLMADNCCPHDENSLNGRPCREIDPESWQFLDKEEMEERAIFDGQLIKYKYDHDKKSYMAYLDSGEFALGDNMYNARVNLTKDYQEKKNERL